MSEYKNKDYRNIAFSLLNKYNLSEDDKESLFFTALTRCKDKHKKGKRKFESSLYLFVKWEILQHLRNECRWNDRHKSYSNHISYINETKIFIDDCLNQLSDENRNLIIDRFYGKMTYKEISKKNGYTTPTAKKKLMMAQKAFKRLWETV